MPNLKKYFLLDPDIVFLNHGSFGAVPRPVFDEWHEWQYRMERQPVKFLGRELDGLLHESRSKLGEYLNADTDDLVYIPNATHGVNIAARSLELNPGDEILTTNHEYGACDHTWNYICGKTGAKYVRTPVNLPLFSQEEIVNQLWSGVTPQTRIIYLSYITSPTAFRIPVEQVCRRAKAAGIVTMIDAAHAPGQIPVDIKKLGADFVIGNCHKWMLNIKGSAFLYVRDELQDLIQPFVVSWGYDPTPETTSGSRFIDLFQWTGTKDPTAALTVPTAIRFMQEHNWEEVRKECHELLRVVIEKICELTDLSPLYPLDSEFYGQMGIAPLPLSNLSILKKRLYEDYMIEVPLIQWQDQQFIRISVQGYNSREDINALVDALYRLLPQASA